MDETDWPRVVRLLEEAREQERQEFHERQGECLAAVVEARRIARELLEKLVATHERLPDQNFLRRHWVQWYPWLEEGDDGR